MRGNIHSSRAIRANTTGSDHLICWPRSKVHGTRRDRERNRAGKNREATKLLAESSELEEAVVVVGNPGRDIEVPRIEVVAILRVQLHSDEVRPASGVAGNTYGSAAS